MRALQDAAGRVGLALYCALLVFVSQTATATEPPNLDYLYFTAAGFPSNVEPTVRADPSTLSADSEFDLKRDLGFDDSKNLWRTLGKFRIPMSISAEVTDVEIDRHGQARLEGAVRIGQNAFPMHVETYTELDTEIAGLAFRYASMHNQRAEVAASLGAYVPTLEARIASAGDDYAEAQVANDSMPVGGVVLAWDLASRFQMLMQGEYLSIYNDNFDGSIGNLRAGIQYQALENFDLGLGYDYFEVDVESVNTDFPGLLDYQFKGPKAFLSLRF